MVLFLLDQIKLWDDRKEDLTKILNDMRQLYTSLQVDEEKLETKMKSTHSKYPFIIDTMNENTTKWMNNALNMDCFEKYVDDILLDKTVEYLFASNNCKGNVDEFLKELNAAMRNNINDIENPRKEDFLGGLSNQWSLFAA